MSLPPYHMDIYTLNRWATIRLNIFIEETWTKCKKNARSKRERNWGGKKPTSEVIAAAVTDLLSDRHYHRNVSLLLSPIYP